MVPGPPTGEGWAESGEWFSRARRLGPLRYSALGRRVLDPILPGSVPALAAWIAASADRWWRAAGQPDPFTLVVASGDDGTVAAAVLDAGPECGPALRYVVVHPDAAGRAEPPPALARLVQLEDPVFLYPSSAGAVSEHPDEDEFGDERDLLELDPEDRIPARGIGPLATFLTDVPSLGEGEGAVIAIEVLSRWPYDLYQWADKEWSEVRVAAAGDGLEEITVPADEEATGFPDASGSGSASTSDQPYLWARQTGASGWLRRILPTATATTAVLAVVDRWDPPGGLDLGQLRLVREPLEPEPTPIAGTALAAVSWALGDRARPH